MAAKFVTKSKLIEDFKNLGLKSGDTVMLHASVKSIGWVVGGPDVVLDALEEVIGSDGTLMMYVSWDQSPYEMQQWPAQKREAVLRELPPFEPLKSRANIEWSILTEWLRTRTGAYQSAHPEASVVAVGKNAKLITSEHPFTYGYGPGSPFDKFHKLGGKVLMLGAPLETLTILHYAEHFVDVPNKKIVRYQSCVLQEGKRTWVDFEEYDTSNGIVDWEGDTDYFQLIGEAFLKAGKGNRGFVGNAETYLFDAREIVEFGRRWMEENFKPLSKKK